MTSIPIRPGTARRLGLRRPAVWVDTMERSTRPAWGSTDRPDAWTVTNGSTWSQMRQLSGDLEGEKR